MPKGSRFILIYFLLMNMKRMMKMKKFIVLFVISTKNLKTQNIIDFLKKISSLYHYSTSENEDEKILKKNQLRC